MGRNFIVETAYHGPGEQDGDLVKLVSVEAARVSDLSDLYRYEAACGKKEALTALTALAHLFIDTPIGDDLETILTLARNEYRRVAE